MKRLLTLFFPAPHGSSMRFILPLLLMATPALAQDPILLTLDSGVSQWSWTGTSSIGPINGNPSTNFALSGGAAMTLDAGFLPIGTGSFVPGGQAMVFPDLHGVIPNPLPFLPPLATIDVTGLTLQFTSDPFSISGSGAFTTQSTTTALTGTVTVSTLTGSTSVIDMTNISGDPQTLAGTVIQVGNTVTMHAPSSGTFSFIDPGTGISADFTISGIIHGSWTSPTPTSYCTAVPNSTGMSAILSVTGSTRIQDDNLTITASQMPVGQFAYFIVSHQQGFVVGPGGSQGNICLSGNLGRFNTLVGQVDAFGTFTRTLSVSSIPVNPAVSARIGETWNYQVWFRDANPGTTSNFSQGLAVTFAP